jgi:hypothetical protein
MTSEKDRDGNGWSQYEKLVMSTLQELKMDVKDIKAEQSRTSSEILLLKLKSSFWGALSGLGAYALLWAAEYLKRRP